MKRILLTSIALVLLAAALVSSGCGSGPAGAVGSILGSLSGGSAKEARAACYDKYSFEQVTEALQGSTSGGFTVISVSGPSTTKIRKKGVKLDTVMTFEERIAGPMAALDEQYKPQIAKAEQDLKDAKAELASAEAQVKYAEETWFGPGAYQIYNARAQVARAQPRVIRAQSSLDTLGGQYQAEAQTIRTSAEDQYKAEKSKWDREFLTKGVKAGYVKVVADVGKGPKKARKTFTVVNEEGSWKVYSVR